MGRVAPLSVLRKLSGRTRKSSISNPASCLPNAHALKSTELLQAWHTDQPTRSFAGSRRKGMRWSAIIKQVRLTRGLKQQALASLLGVSQSALSRWENHQDEPNLAAAKKLLAMASPPPVGNLGLFSAEANAKFCPLAISTRRSWSVGTSRSRVAGGSTLVPVMRLTASWRARGSITIERAESARAR